MRVRKLEIIRLRFPFQTGTILFDVDPKGSENAIEPSQGGLLPRTRLTRVSLAVGSTVDDSKNASF